MLLFAVLLTVGWVLLALAVEGWYERRLEARS